MFAMSFLQKSFYFLKCCEREFYWWKYISVKRVRIVCTSNMSSIEGGGHLHYTKQCRKERKFDLWRLQCTFLGVFYVTPSSKLSLTLPHRVLFVYPIPPRKPVSGGIRIWIDYPLDLIFWTTLPHTT